VVDSWEHKKYKGLCSLITIKPTKTTTEEKDVVSYHTIWSKYMNMDISHQEF
jgi:hypothetical protein